MTRQGRIPICRSWGRGSTCALLLALPLFCACDHDPASPTEPETPGLWARYTPFDWTHDGAPHATAFLTVYSDGASDALKRDLGVIADERFLQILDLFQQQPGDLVYPPGAARLEIYLNTQHAENVNWAYWGGFIITLRASEIAGPWYDYTVYTVRHELTHDLELLIEGREWIGTDVWFKEGIAAHVGCLETTVWSRLRTLEELESWVAQNQDVEGSGNPIRIHDDSDYPVGADRDAYARLFELAVRYLLDGDGQGASFPDVAALFHAVREGASFSVAFQERFGVTLADFEAEFYDRMRSYLGAGGVSGAVPSGALVLQPR